MILWRVLISKTSYKLCIFGLSTSLFIPPRIIILFVVSKVFSLYLLSESKKRASAVRGL